MNAVQMKHAAGLEVLRQRIMECRASGRPVREWCEQEGYSPSTYYRWEREVFGRLKRPKAEKESSVSAVIPHTEQSLVELPLADPDSHALACMEETGIAVGSDSCANAITVYRAPEEKAPVFHPVAVLRMGGSELSLTNEVSAKLMRQLQELLSHAE